MQAEVRADPLEQRLDPMIETECFRVAQEALTNVVKHAKAHTVTVELSQNERTGNSIYPFAMMASGLMWPAFGNKPCAAPAWAC